MTKKILQKKISDRMKHLSRRRLADEIAENRRLENQALFDEALTNQYHTTLQEQARIEME
jgi:hypothetical protein